MMERAKKMMPANRLGRLIVGVLLVIGGILGFLPIVGFWMIPLGLIILSVDSPFIRRRRRRLEVRLGRWWRNRQEKKAQMAQKKRKAARGAEPAKNNPEQDQK